MKLTSMNELPRRKRGPHDLQGVIVSFIESGAKVAKVEIEPDEYKSFDSFCTSMHNAVKVSKRAVRVHTINHEVYLEKI